MYCNCTNCIVTVQIVSQFGRAHIPVQVPEVGGQPPKRVGDDYIFDACMCKLFVL